MRYIREYGTTAALVLAGVFLVYLVAWAPAHPLNGQPAPPFTLNGLEGNSVALADHLGKDVVVLDFWASWCPPCRKGLPVLDALAREYADRNVAVYAVNIREDARLVKDFFEQNKLSVPVLLDEKGLVADGYGVTGIPQTVIIDRSGTISAIHVGVSPFGFESAMRADIDAALAAGAATETAADPAG